MGQLEGFPIGADQIRFIKERMSTLGIPIRGGSRYAQMFEVLEQNGVNSDEERYIARTSVRDMQHLTFILTQLAGNADEETKKRLRVVLSDPAIADPKVDESKGRNMQTELYIFAHCKKAGLNPKWVEPDIRVDLRPHLEYSIAIKRCKSDSKLLNRIEDGIDQVIRSGLQGCVVADVTLIDTQGKDITETLPGLFRQQAAEYDQRAQEMVHRLCPQVLKRAEGTPVNGIVFVMNQIMYNEDGWRLCGHFPMLRTAYYNQRRAQQFFDFYNRFIDGGPTPVQRMCETPDGQRFIARTF